MRLRYRTFTLALLLALIGWITWQSARSDPIARVPTTVVPDPTASVAADVVQLRITNASATSLDQLIVGFPNQQIDFGAVPAGATTEYRAVPGGVYSYAAYRATFNGQTIMQGVADWIGERPLRGTAFTYILQVDPAQPLVPIQNDVHQD